MRIVCTNGSRTERFADRFLRGMSIRFPEQSRLRAALRAAWYRTAGGRRKWHNRCFASTQMIEEDELGFVVRWPGHGEVRARKVRELARIGTLASILASGPSVRSLRRPERLFARPVCCVNGSVELAAALGARPDYYVVNDPRFVVDRTDLFAAGARASRAVVLCPMTVFAAMLAAPDAVTAGNVFLCEDLRRPFKRARPTRSQLLRDPLVIADADTDLAFSLDPGIGAFPAGTVVFQALQLMFGIGYREIHMFGVDLTDGPRFYHERNPATSELAQSYDRQIEPAFRLVAEYLRRSGAVLLNGSPASRLPDSIVPKADGNLLLDRLTAGQSCPAAPS
jgi:Kdo-III transferase WaaZ